MTSADVEGWVRLSLAPEIGPKIAHQLLARFGSPDAIFASGERELLGVQREGDRAALARLELDAREAAQLLHGPRPAGLDVADVELHDLAAGARPGVRRRDAHLDRPPRRRSSSSTGPARPARSSCDPIRARRARAAGSTRRRRRPSTPSAWPACGQLLRALCRSRKWRAWTSCAATRPVRSPRMN